MGCREDKDENLATEYNAEFFRNRRKDKEVIGGGCGRARTTERNGIDNIITHGVRSVLFDGCGGATMYSTSVGIASLLLWVRAAGVGAR